MHQCFVCNVNVYGITGGYYLSANYTFRSPVIYIFSQQDLFFFRHICKGHETLFRILNALGGNGIVGPLALFAPRNNAAVAENFHMVGKGGLSDVHFFKEHTGALFSALQKLQYPYAVLIAEGFEDNGGLFCVKFHYSSPFIVKPILYACSVKRSARSARFLLLP